MFSRARALIGIPVVQPESVTIMSSPSACDEAANKWRLARVALGEPDTLWPMLLIRLGDSRMYFGTTRMERDRDYLLLDSLFSYVGALMVP